MGMSLVYSRDKSTRSCRREVETRDHQGHDQTWVIKISPQQTIDTITKPASVICSTLNDPAVRSVRVDWQEKGTDYGRSNCVSIAP